VTGQLLANDVALVTGATSGIGAAIVRALAREGARTFLTDNTTKDVGALAQSLASSGSETAFLAADLNTPSSCDRIVNAAVQKFGPISILVHAASPGSSEPALEVSEGTWDEMLAVNLRAGYRMASQLGKIMMRHKINGRMLFITSLHARTPRGNPAYGAAKAGLEAMMGELAKALGPHGIRVNAIAPGLIAQNWYPKAEPTIRVTPLRRMGKPEDVAGIAIALLVDKFSGFVTGTTVTVDGGLSLHNWLDGPS
jgi:3-oxoacyl-[acyl-carrier protein] reductase